MTWVPRAGLISALVLFAGLSLNQIDLPGLQNDEAQEAGLQAVQLVSGLPISAFRGAGLAIGEQTYPLMAQDYIGALHIYLTAPFVALLGPTPMAVRLPAVMLGVLALGLLYRLMSRVATPAIGALAALLLATEPSFVFWMRQGVYVTNVTLSLEIGMALAGLEWARAGGRIAAFVAGLCAGLAAYAKLNSLWVLGGVLGSIMVLNLPIVAQRILGRPARWWPRAPARSEVTAFLAGGLAGLSPLIAYNLQTGGTLASVANNLTNSFYGVNNLDYLANLAARWDQFRAVLAGRDHLWYLGGSAGNPWREWALYGGAAALTAGGFRGLGRVRALWTTDGGPEIGGNELLPVRSALLIPLSLALAVLQSPFTVSGIFPTHFAVTLWLPAAIVALGAREAAVAFGGWWGRAATAALVVCLGALFWRDLSVDVAYHRYLQASGGLGPHSDAIYRLTEALAKYPPGTQVVAMDWGFAPQVRYLSGEEVAPVEVFGYSLAPDPEFAARLAPYLEQPGAVFIFHWTQETIFPRREVFDALLAERGLEAEVLQDITRRDGAPVFRLATVARNRP